MYKKIKRYFIGILIFILVTSCASIDSQINQALIDSNYKEARELLENAGAGYKTKEKLSEKEIQARNLFENKVSEDFLRKMDSYLSQGELLKAFSIIEQAIDICPWSSELENQLLLLNNRISETKRIERQWQAVNREKFLDIVVAREFLSEIEPIEQDFRISDLLVERYYMSIDCIDNYWATLLGGIDKIDNKNLELLKIFQDFRFEPFSNVTSTEFYRLYKTILTDSYFSISKILSEISENYLTSSQRLPSYAKGNGAFIKIRELVLDWFDDNIDIIFNEEPSFKNLNYVEKIASNLDVENNERFKNFKDSRYRYILSAAERLSGQSTAALLSLVYLNHATNLDSYRIEDTLQIHQSALSSLQSSQDFSADLYINASGAVPLWQYKLVRLALFTNIQNNSSSTFKWNLQAMDSRSQDNEIKIVGVNYYNPSIDDLIEKQSTYLSHYENVPNPYKESLKYDLANKKRQAEYALRTYEIAVNNYNINGSQWALNSANQAYTTYQYAVDAYNRVVSIYNTTPETISRPVYLPYTFYEGNVKIGWEITVEVIYGDQKKKLRGYSVESDFVRLGTNRSDRKAVYRIDDPLEMRIDSEESIRLLFEASSKITDKLWDFINNTISLQFISNLEEEEIDIIKTIIHPWGGENKISSWPYWLKHSIETIKFPDLSPKPSPIRIVDCHSFQPRLDSDQNISEAILSSIVLITSKDTDGNSSYSSGALISNDGLILTCAHGLTGKEISISINRDTELSTYTGDIKYVDSYNDVAVLKADNLYSDTWLNVRLNSGVQPGEPVLAFGNPLLEDGSLAKNAVTSGAVAVAKHDGWGSQRIVTDITIASGSSGGPLISKNDGSIIGVVVAISSPEYANPISGRSATGMYALVAPAIKFNDWIGLTK